MNLNIDEERDLLVTRLKERKLLTSSQAEDICSRTRRDIRVGALINSITRNMTTKRFLDFLDALGDNEICGMTELREKMLRAYEEQGGRLSIESLPSIDNSNLDRNNILNQEVQITSQAYDVTDFIQPCSLEEEVTGAHVWNVGSQIICCNEDPISNGKPMILLTQDDRRVTDVSPGQVDSKMIFFNLVDRKTVGEHSLVDLSGHILHCFAVDNDRYCLVSSVPSQQPDEMSLQVSLWPNPSVMEIDLKDVECQGIDKLSACVVISQEKVVLLIISQDSCKVNAYFICNDKIDDGGSRYVELDTITGVRSASFESNSFCVFWGGNAMQVFEIDTDIGLDPHSPEEVSGEIACCEFIPCTNGDLLAVCYSDSPSECSHSIDLWQINPKRRLDHKTCVHELPSGTRMCMLFDEHTRQLIVSVDHHCRLITYNPFDQTLVEVKRMNVAVEDSYGSLLQHKLMKSDETSLIHFVRIYDTNVVIVTHIPLRDPNSICVSS